MAEGLGSLMAATKTFRFGPGSLESLALRVWTARSSGGERVKAETVGTFTVYCGAGWSHTVRIDEGFSGWRSETEHDSEARLLFAARGGDEDAARELAERAVEYALEGWFDPCDEGD